MLNAVQLNAVSVNGALPVKVASEGAVGQWVRRAYPNSLGSTTLNTAALGGPHVRLKWEAAAGGQWVRKASPNSLGSTTINTAALGGPHVRLQWEGDTNTVVTRKVRPNALGSSALNVTALNAPVVERTVTESPGTPEAPESPEAPSSGATHGNAFTDVVSAQASILGIRELYRVAIVDTVSAQASVVSTHQARWHVDQVVDVAHTTAGLTLGRGQFSGAVGDTATGHGAPLALSRRVHEPTLLSSAGASDRLLQGRLSVAARVDLQIAVSADLLTDRRGRVSTVESLATARADVIRAGATFGESHVDTFRAQGALLGASRGYYDTLQADARGDAIVPRTIRHAAGHIEDNLAALGAVLGETVKHRQRDIVTNAFRASDLAYQSAAARDNVVEGIRAASELVGNAAGVAWVFNTRTLAMTRYAGFDASQVTSIRGRVMAGGNRGLQTYAVHAGARGRIRTGLTDFGSPQIKSLRGGYLTAAGGQPITLNVLHGIGEALQTTEYRPDIRGSVVPQTYRVNLSRGNRGTFWGFEIVAPEGERTTLLNLRVLPVVTSRRV